MRASRQRATEDVVWDKPLHPRSFPPEDVPAIPETHAIERTRETGKA